MAKERDTEIIVIRIECVDIEPSEVASLRKALKAEEGIIDVKEPMRRKARGALHDVVLLLVHYGPMFAKGAAGGVGTAVGATATNAIIKAVKKWYSKRKRAEEEKIVIYGADGKVAKRIKK